MNRARPYRIAQTFLLLLVLVIATACSADVNASVEPTKPGSLISMQLRQPAQKVSAQDASGRHVRVFSSGHPSLINFWASWCSPCQAEIPELQRLSQAYRSRVDFIGIDTRDQKSSALSFLKSLGVTYPTLFDEEGTVAQSIGRLTAIQGLPFSLLIDSHGRIAALYLGMVSASEVNDALTELLANH